MHRTVGLVEPRCNIMKGGQWKYKTGQVGLVNGFYWQYTGDDTQLLNSTDVMRAVAATRHGWYKAIETTEQMSTKLLVHIKKIFATKVPLTIGLVETVNLSQTV